MAFLQIRLLGRPEISHEDQPVSDDLSAKAIALLAYLLAGPEGGSTRDELSGLFWGDADEEHANYYLRRTLWALRKALNPPAAATDTYICFYEGRYFFQTGSDYWLDLSEFQRVLSPSTREFPAQPGPPIGFGTPGRERVTLAAGLALYRGKFLQGLHLRGYAGVMDWIDYCRDKLEKLYVGGLRALALEEARLPNQGGAIAAYEQVVALDPLDEDAVSGLMVAYYNAGAREKALERYRSFQRALRQQLELEPLPETRKLYLDIRSGSLFANQSYDLGPPGKPARPGAISVPLIGREAEAARLYGALELAVQGARCLAVVSGEAGIGKTRLVEEFLRRIAAFPVTLLSARCYAQERSLPFQPVIDALRVYLPGADKAHLRCLSSLWLGEVARLLPELQEYLPEGTAVPRLYPDQERNRLFEGLTQFVAHLSLRKPVILFLDDLHAADEPTFDLIHYLARRLATSRVLLVGALRIEALADRPALARLLRELERDSRLISIPLARLSESGTAELVRRALGTQERLDELARRLHIETGGNPFFLLEMLQAHREGRGPASEDGGVPASVSDLIQHRLDQVDEQSRQLLALAAVVGRQFNSSLLHQVHGGDEQDLLTMLEWLVTRGWIAEVPGAAPGTYDFSHGLVREAVYKALRADRRQRLHRRVGLALEATGGDDVDELTGVLAHHFLMGGDYEKSLSYSLRAAARASRLYAHNEAIIHYHRAIRIVEGGDACLSPSKLLDVNCRLAEACEFLGQYDAAIAIGEAALPALRAGDPDFRRINFQLAVAYDRRGQYDQALACLRAMEEGLTPGTDADHRLDAARVARGMAMIHLHRERSRVALTYCSRALELLEESESHLVDPARAAAAGEEGVEVYEIMANCHYHLGDYESAARYYRQALDLAQAREWRRSIPRLLRGLAEVARHRGDYQAAGDYALRSIANSEEIGDVAGTGASYGALGNLSYNYGDLDQSTTHFRHALDVFRQIGDQHGIADCCLSLAYVEIDLAQIDEADAHLQEALNIGRQINAALVLIRATYHSAKVARARGQWEIAESTARQAIALAHAAGISLMEAMGQRVLGEILAERGRLPEAEIELLTSLDLFESQRDRFETAWTWRSYALFLMRQGKARDARRWLGRAAETFEELGARREATVTRAAIGQLITPME